MGYLGISLIVASVVLFCLRPPAWLPNFVRNLQQGRLGSPPRPPLIKAPGDEDDLPAKLDANIVAIKKQDGLGVAAAGRERSAAPKRQSDEPRMPPPRPLVLEEKDGGQGGPRTDSGYDEQTTPKAWATILLDAQVPSFTLSGAEPSSSGDDNTAAASGAGVGINNPSAAVTKNVPPAPGLMAPPPRPPTLRSQPRPAAGSPFLSPAPGRLLPVPNRGPLLGGGSGLTSSTLAPPPTHSSKPKKPSKQVALQPGHSPLDWARITGPGANLRGLPNNSPYLRVTPSMLRRQTGRKGTDAWTVLGGRVYNIGPYVPFHPGGGPELLRGAGKDGTQLFGEIHPWVNYEGMLSACLIGLYVPEEPPKDDEDDD
ncbi:hypothetical protein B0T24DRAFT_100635 [Lasiosphaeria ovina]|uniref:Cytochrome b5 heme-binding domain-containing protein n=1 Tax=Lasiosphaeria ovina TaxID=92902 RepID=A0AAE0N043_9PEZI|nr:hypothetical protein B0T24DRAFT_100635 [Lasiosphaeria ovina]